MRRSTWERRRGGLRREEAISLIEEVQGLQRRLEHLRGELRRLVEEE